MGKKKNNQEQFWEQRWRERRRDLLDAIKKATPAHRETKAKQGLPFVEFANVADLSPSDAQRFLEYILHRGANVYARGNRLFAKAVLPVTKWTYEDLLPLEEVEVFGERFTGLRFGVVSDTHFGSNRTNLDVLAQAYEHFAAEGITSVLHVGNVLAGRGHRAYRQADREVTTLEGQVELLQRQYPRQLGVKTYFILGYSDRTFETDDINPAHEITEARPDFSYLGMIEADLAFNPEQGKSFRVRLYNEKLYYYYGISYQQQKKIENMAGGDRPAIWLVGGTQQSWSSRYQGVEIRKLPGLQHQTMQMRDRAYQCTVGFSVLTIALTEKGPKLYTHLYPDMGTGPSPVAVAQRRAA